MRRTLVRIGINLVVAIVIGSVLALAPHETAAQSTPAPVAGDAALGKMDFQKYGCYECHGTAGQGNFLTAPQLAPHPWPYSALVGYIRKPAGSMPSYSAAILSDKVAADIYAYLSSIGPGKRAAQIPLLSGTSVNPK